MARRLKDRTGDQIGLWLVIERDTSRTDTTYWWCMCTGCGSMHSRQASNLDTSRKRVEQGRLAGCLDCIRKEISYVDMGRMNATHGMSDKPEYQVWQGMKKRCFNSNDLDSWPHYGGRGITVCERWRDSFQAFYEDMGPRPGPEYSIDRIDVDGNYEPGNCRWATWSEQNLNKRPRMRCFKGHAFDEANTRYDHRKDGRITKACRACDRARGSERKAKEAQA